MRQRGFTILELITVVALLAILSAFALAGWGSVRSGMAVHAAAQQIAMDLALVRTRAINRHVNHRLHFEEGGSRYQSQQWNGKEFVDFVAPRQLPKGVNITLCTAADDAVTFRPRGNALSFGTIVIGNLRGDTRQIVVDIAGRVRIE